MKEISPCKGCTAETGRCANPNCHQTCEKYIDFFNRNEKRKSQIREEKNKEREIGEYIQGRRIKNGTLWQERYK